MLKTMKFGGTSVGSAGAIEQVAHIIAEELEADNQGVAVVSPLSGVSDMLLVSVE
jgi:aspartokinase